MNWHLLIDTLFLLCCLFVKHECFLPPRAPGPNHYRDPCALIDCKEEEICVPNNAISARCILYKNLHLNDEIKFKRIIHKREIVQQERIVSRLATNIKVDRGIAEPCDASECRYGECEIINATYHKCHCVMGVTGNHCNYLSTTSNPCSSNPCFAESACINLSNEKFVCICRSGRSGPTCKGHAAPCQCSVHGKCRLIELDVFTCDCTKGYGGNLCQFELKKQKKITNTDDIHKSIQSRTCTTDTCLNGGTCLQINPSLALCLCPYNFRGPFCDRSIPDKKKLSTKNKLSKNSKINTAPIESTCPVPLQNVCLNGGICQQKKNSSTFSCKCKAGYRGTFCNIREPFCFDPYKCKNGGTCFQTDSINGKCACLPNHKGLFCEIGLECSPNPCQNNQPCLLINGKPKCICIDGFRGPDCNE